MNVFTQPRKRESHNAPPKQDPGSLAGMTANIRHSRASLRGAAGIL